MDDTSGILSITERHDGSGQDQIKKEKEPPLLDDRKKKLLSEKKGVDFFIQIETFVNQEFEEHKEIKKVLQSLSQLRGIEENILHSIKNNDFSLYEASPEEYSVMLELAHLRNKLLQEYIDEAFQHFTADSIGLKEWEKRAIHYLLEIALCHDEMYIKWREVLFPKDMQKMEDTERSSFLGNLKELNDSFSIIEKNDDGVFVQKSYNEAFPRETAKILKYLDELIGVLGPYQQEKDCRAFMGYLHTLQEVYLLQGCTKTGDMWASELKWREVDKKWLKTKGRLQVWHTMEYGYSRSIDISGVRLMPEFRITYLNESRELEKANTYLTILKGAHINYFWKKYFDNEKVIKMLDHMKDCDIGIYGTIMGGGSSLDFRPQGQVGPNDPLISKMGFKSSLDVIRQEETYVKERFILEAICSIDSVIEINQWMLSTLENIGVYIGSHELSHTIFGDWGALEEFKASWTGIVPLEEEENMGFFRSNILRDTLFSHFLCCLRYLITEDRTDPYFLEGVINVHFMLQSGVLVKNKGKWTVQLQQLLEGEQNTYYENVNAFYKKLLLYALEGKWEEMKVEGEKAIVYDSEMEELIRDIQKANVLYYGMKIMDRKNKIRKVVRGDK